MGAKPRWRSTCQAGTAVVEEELDPPQEGAGPRASPDRAPAGPLPSRRGRRPRIAPGSASQWVSRPGLEHVPHTPHEPQRDSCWCVTALCRIWTLTGQDNFCRSVPFMALSYETWYHLHHCQQQTSTERLLKPGSGVRSRRSWPH